MKMKNLSLTNFFKCFFATLVSTCLGVLCWSQDSTRTTVTTKTTEHTEWYTAPWVWIVGGIVVVLLLVAIFSNGRRSSQTTITDTGAGTRTITTDRD